MTKKKEVKKVLLKDIVIPAGTVFSKSPESSHINSDDFVSCVIGLSNNTFGELHYDISDDKDELSKYFADLRE